MPSVSILAVSDAPGEGGGVLSNTALPPLFGWSANDTFFVDDAVDDRGRVDKVGDGEFDGCDLFTFLVGGCCVSAVRVGLDREGR